MKKEIKSILKSHNLDPVKSLGQNFLIDENVLKKIVQAADLAETDIVIEIGPGLGSLTAELAESAGLVLAVEIDKQLMPALNEKLKKYSNIRIMNEDILKLDIEKELETLISEHAGDSSIRTLKVVANLPYYITTPVIMRLLESEIKAETMVFMVQKEVAARMTAGPGGKDYGALSVVVQYYSRPAVIMDVSRDSFIPSPGVDSSIIRLDKHKMAPVKLLDREIFFKVVKAAFGQRRKMLPNALANSGLFNLDKEQIKTILLEIGISEKRRGETLSIGEFASLANKTAQGM